jgi:hypothetical protein
MVANPIVIIYKMVIFSKDYLYMDYKYYLYNNETGYRRRKFFLPFLLLLQIFVNPLILLCYVVPYFNSYWSKNLLID